MGVRDTHPRLPRGSTRESHWCLPDASAVHADDTRRMAQITSDTHLPECLAQQSFLVAECTIPSERTIREWGLSRRGKTRRTRRQAISRSVLEELSTRWNS